ncbi:ABC transporter permease [Aquimarina sp. AU474]|uniref:ABC transporter permease n=1 Tax=Aquimarina sp. AU474 TaxID=2108529 RepID=UPI000D687B49|nr:ABC transporter permease [Aquimarina sp. AU474]
MSIEVKKYFRSIKRSKISFIINLIGLSLGMVCVLLIYLWSKDEIEYDKFHENDNQLYQMMINQRLNNEFQTNKYNSLPFINAIAENIPEIEDVASVVKSYSTNVLSLGQKNINVKGIYASKDFFNLFTFNLLDGNKESTLKDKYNIVLSKNLAEKLFGTSENVVGKFVKFDNKQEFLVTGVTASFPKNSSIQFDYVIPISLYEEHTGLELTWGENVVEGFFLMNPNIELSFVNRKIKTFLGENGIDTNQTSLFVRRFSKGYLYGDYDNGIQKGGRIEYVRLFIIIGIVILVIACINFISLSTAMAMDKMKEVGIKKVLGVERKSIIVRYLGESTLLSLFSFLISLIFVFLLLPWFNQLTDKNMTLSLNYDLILPFLLIVLAVGILSGIYPALYISKFKPAQILRNSILNVGGNQILRKGLVITQFTASIILVVFTLVTYDQFSMIQNRNLGYDKDNVLYFEMDGEVVNKRETFLTELRRVPGVAQASSVFVLRDGILGQDMVTNDITWPTKQADEILLIDYRIVNYDFIESLGIEVLEGRSFSKEFPSSNSNVYEIVLNETAVKMLRLEQPVGKIINIWGGDKVIVGVVKDFSESIYDGKIKPMVFMHLINRGFGAFNTIVTKIDPSYKLSETINKIESFHASFNPGFPLNYKFLNQDFQNQYSSERRLSVLSRCFTALAIIISCLGLFGLTVFTVNKRKKEISIRKVMGSSGSQITILLFKDVFRLVIITLLIGIPISYFWAQNWLENFAVRVDLKPWIFIISGLFFFVLVVLISGIQASRISSINPATTLKNQT